MAAGTSFLDRAIDDSFGRISSVKAAVGANLSRGSMSAGSPASYGAAGIGAFGGIGQSFSSMAKAEEQYKHFTGWNYVAVNRIATRVAGQPVLVGKKAKKAKLPKKEKPGKEEEGDAELRVGRRRLKAFEKSRLPRGVKVAIGDAELDLIENHPILEAIDDPNPILVRWSLFYNTIASIELTGKAYWWLPKPAKGEKQQIWPIPAGWVTPVHSEKELFVGYMVLPRNGMEPYFVERNRMAFFSLPDPADPLGCISPMQTQSPAIAVDEAIQTAQFRMMENGVFPGVILRAGRLPGILPGQPGELPIMTADQRRELRDAIKAVYEGTVQFNEPLIVDGLIEGVERFTNSPQEMDFINSAGNVKSRIMQAYGVNPIVAGEIAGVNRATAAVADDIFCSNVVNPILELVSQVMTAWIAQDEPETIIWVEPCRSKDVEQRLREWQAAATNQFITGNEFRAEILGLPPLEGLDELPKPPAPPNPFGGMGPDGKPFPPGAEEDENGKGKQEPGKPGEKPGQKPADDEEGGKKPQFNFFGGKGVKSYERALRPWEVVPEPWRKGVMQNKLKIARWKSFCDALFIKAADRRELDLAAACKAVFQQMGKSVADKVMEVYRKNPLLFEQDGGPERIAEMVFDAGLWQGLLDKAVAAPMARAVAAGYQLGEQTWKPRVKTRAALSWRRAADDDDTLADLIANIQAGLPAAGDFEIPQSVLNRINREIRRITQADWWTNITKSQLDAIATEISDGIAEDPSESVQQIATRIAGVLGDDDGARSRLIARTEVTGLMNAGHQVQMREVESSGVKLTKVWSDTGDHDVRESHQIGGQTVDGSEGMFAVTNLENPKSADYGQVYEVPYPGHDSLPAELRCNCRCSVLVFIDESQLAEIEAAEAEEGVPIVDEGELPAEEVAMLGDFDELMPDEDEIASLDVTANAIGSVAAQLGVSEVDGNLADVQSLLGVLRGSLARAPVYARTIGAMSKKIGGSADIGNFLTGRKTHPATIGVFYAERTESFPSPNGAVAGFYDPSIKAVAVATAGRKASGPVKLGGWTVDDSVAGTVRHEVGYHVADVMGKYGDLAVEGGDFWGELEDVWANEEAVGVVSMQATASPADLFAEAFAAVTHPSYAGGLPDVIAAFMGRWIG